MKKDKLPLWSLFHENSKITKHTRILSGEQVLETVSKSYQGLPYFASEKVHLSTNIQLSERDIIECIMARKSSRALKNSCIDPDSLSTLLYCAAGIRGKEDNPEFPVPFRMIPSGGALYPTEVYVYLDNIETLKPGLYYYNAPEHSIVLVRAGNLREELKNTIPKNDFVDGATMLVFLTSIFDKSTFKYGERGYRFALMEAGHMAQNLCLTATAFSLDSLPIGGFYDDKVNDFLEIDGIHHAALYMLAFG